MSNVSYWLNKAGYSLINRFIVFFFGFAAYFLMVRHLDKSAFGVYSLYLVIVTISELAISAFVQNAFVKFYLDKSFEKSKVFGSSSFLNICLTVFSALSIFLLSEFIADFYGHRELGSMLRIYCINSLLLIPYAQLYYYLNAEVNFRLISIIAFIRYGSFFVMVLVSFIYFPEVDQVDYVIFQAISLGIGAAISLYFLGKIQFSLFDFDRDIIKKLFHFGKYIFGVGITSILTRSVDQLMIGYFMSAEAVASYNVAGRFMNFIEVPVTSIAQVIYPKFAETVNAENPQKERARIFEGSVGIMMAVIAPFILIIFIIPSFFITIVAGENYLNAIPILQILILFNLVKPFATQAGAVLEVSGKPKIGFYALLFTSVLNIILNYYFIQLPEPIGGIMGAALASVLSGVCYLIIVLRAIHIECAVSLIETFRQFLKAYGLGYGILTDIIKQKLNKKN